MHLHSQHKTSIMASSLSFITLITSLLLFTPHSDSAPVAPGPTPPPLNLTAILEKGSQYSVFLRLLKDTQVGQQIQSQLKNSFEGLTIFAPTDNAFNQLKAGTLNSLTTQEQVSLVLYHVLPRFYSLNTFQTTSNPVRTQASGNDGIYTINVTSTTNQVNVSTGINETPVNSVLYADFPLAVFSVDQVLKPYDLFGAKPPALAPAPAKAKVPVKAKKKAPVVADAPVADAEASTSGSSLSLGSGLGLGLSLGFGFMCIIGLV